MDTWDYGESGRVPPDQHTIVPEMRPDGEGAAGGVGEADLALGSTRRARADTLPWDARKTGFDRKVVPQMTIGLPADEAERLKSACAREMERLTADCRYPLPSFLGR